MSKRPYYQSHQCPFHFTLAAEMIFKTKISKWFLINRKKVGVYKSNYSEFTRTYGVT